ncbi:MAG: glycosyltransferase [Bacteroidota bacterium]|nr:glycosyltransferase [Bacteroidota bacterium]MDP4233033.1 glycosyltransferase [Bacteroidota bacterium]MDP4241822.1 glycosyltransferase [Bacteroidota bacterium]MDP4288757.1 glycosyltransferase [Bacteroidota bacterium]
MIYVALFCIALLLYSYVGFPVLIRILAKVAPRKSGIDESYQPAVSIILPAFNEELILADCLTSLVNLKYPAEKIEILCGSDGSTDRTNSILLEFAARHQQIKPVLFPGQRGKMLTLNDLVAKAKNEILLFVDADITLHPNTLLCHVRHYADPETGAVAGHLAMDSEQATSIYKSENSYWHIESDLRKHEAAIWSTLAVYGGNYSIRRELWQSLPDGRVSDDFFVGLQVALSGKRILFDEGAISIEQYGRTYPDEFQRKRRTTARTIHTLSYFRSSLIRGRVAWLLWPHKVLRWFAMYIVLALVASTFLSLYSPLAVVLLLIELALGLLVVIGWVSKGLKSPIPVASQIYWLFSMNIALALGVIDFLFSSPGPLWAQTTRIANDLTPSLSREVSAP